MSFKDHFSDDPGGYRRYRPVYPPALFSWLAERAQTERPAWDCATGSGQAASGLARHFRCVVASDASVAQISRADSAGGIRYFVCRAEAVPLRDHSVGLVTVAQAAHWFDLARFYAEARRVLAPAGLLAMWTYGLLNVMPAVDALLNHFHTDLLGDYWPPERRFVDAAYADLPFPFERLEAPSFTLEARWRLADMLGYLGTWSAVRRYADREGVDPRELIREELESLWGRPDAVRKIEWPLTVLATRMG